MQGPKHEPIQALPREPLQALILDLDGVLWRGSEPLGDLPAIFAAIARRGWQVILATNNATLPPLKFIHKLAGFGVQLEDWQVVTSAMATAEYMKRRFPEGGAVYVIGEVGLQEGLRGAGFEPVGVNADGPVIAVVAGLDRQVTYPQLARACLLVEGGVPFIASNPDSSLPTPEGLIPGAGAITGVITTTTGVAPEVIGKPSPRLYQLALERLGAVPETVLVVGDRLDTDITGAQALGCRTGLVLTGVASEAEAHAWQPALDWIAADLAALLAAIPEGA
jgi:4-nitrophenyl phosphatase